jgi:hypothetical protein
MTVLGFSSLPIDLKSHILTFLGPSGMNVHQMKKTALGLTALMDQESRTMMNEKIQELFIGMKISELTRKYSKYNKLYELHCFRWEGLVDPSFSSAGLNQETIDDNRQFLQTFHPAKYPQLLDALCTGYRSPGASHSIKKYSSEVENDIQNIVKLMPRSVDCRMGSLLHRTEVSPLGMACMNRNIPLSMVDWLLANGANPHDTWSVIDGSDQVRIVDCLPNHWCAVLGSQRIQVLLETFARYGAKPQ